MGLRAYRSLIYYIIFPICARRQYEFILYDTQNAKGVVYIAFLLEFLSLRSYFL